MPFNGIWMNSKSELRPRTEYSESYGKYSKNIKGKLTQLGNTSIKTIQWRIIVQAHQVRACSAKFQGAPNNCQVRMKIGALAPPRNEMESST